MAKLVLVSVVLVVSVICFSAVVNAGTVIDVSPSTPNWKSVLTQAFPAGTIVRLASGTYTHSGRFYLRLSGTRTNPIRIIGPSDGSAIFLQTNPSGANAMEIDGSNFELRNFKLNQGSLGLRLGLSQPMSNVLINFVEIFNTQGTALTLNTVQSPIAVHRNITVRRCSFHDTNYGVAAASQTAECLYWGASPSCSGTCPACSCSPNGAYVVDSVIDNNICYNTLQARVGWGSGFQVKGGSNGISITDNVCYNVLGPCILTYASSYTGFVGKINQILRNLVWNSYDVAIQTTQGSNITGNIIVGNTHVYGIGVIPNQGTPAAVKIEGNTIFNGNTASIYVGGLSVGNGGIIISNNAIFASVAAFRFPDSASIVNSKVLGVANGVNGNSGWNWNSPTAQFTIGNANTELVNPAGYNFRPKLTSALLNKANRNDITLTDFDCRNRVRSNLTVGAYQYFSDTSSQWAVAPQTMKNAPLCD